MTRHSRFFLLTLLLLGSISAGAQSMVTENVFKDITVQAKVRNTRFARPNPAGKTRKAGKPVAFYIGDSTMRTNSDGQGWNGQWGFGLFAQEWFVDTLLVVENHALGGTSSRTYYNYEWPTVKAGIKEGDIVVISFGHNDGGSLWTSRSTISGTSATETREVTNDKGVKETVYTFGQYLRFYIDETRALGATPILCSRTPRGGFSNGQLGIDTKYRQWGMTIAAEKGTAYIDLEGVANPMYNAFGEWKVTQFYEAGTLHTSLLGAWHNAYCHALSIAADTLNPLYPYLKDMTTPRMDIDREEGQPYTFTAGGSDTSARGTFRSGRWGLIYNTIEKGDTVKLCFGENDLGSIDGGKELGCIQSADDTKEVKKMSNTGRWATVYSYGWYMHYFINDIKERGGIAVIVNEEGRTPATVAEWNVQLAATHGVELRHVSAAAVKSVVSDESTAPAYNLMGMPVGNGYRGIMIRNGKKIVTSRD